MPTVSEMGDRDFPGREIRPTSDTPRLGSDVDQLASPVLVDQGQKVLRDKKWALKGVRLSVRLRAREEGPLDIQPP